MDKAGINEMKIQPYSPEWFKLRQGTFTASEIYKLMTEPKGKSPNEKYIEQFNILREWEAKYHASKNKELKSIQALWNKIASKQETVSVLFEHKNDIHISDTAETYILEKVHEKLTGQTKMGVDNFATQWGVEHEPLALSWYSKLTANVLHEPHLVFHDVLEGFAVTPDTFVNDNGLAEVKCPANGSNHLKHCFITSPEYFKSEHPEYYWQCLAQMDACKKDWCDFVSFDPRIDSNKGLFIFRLEYNNDDVLLMRNKITVARGLYNDYLNAFAGKVNDTEKA